MNTAQAKAHVKYTKAYLTVCESMKDEGDEIVSNEERQANYREALNDYEQAVCLLTIAKMNDKLEELRNNRG